MKTLLNQSGWLLVMRLLAACDANLAEADNNPVKVTFARPFPVGRADAAKDLVY